MAKDELLWTWLGRVAYDRALVIQHQLRQAVLAHRLPGVLLLLEHPPVITQGRHGRDAHILATTARLQELGVTVHRIERGGDVTLHSPGQLVGYPVLEVHGGVKRFVERLAAAAQSVLADLGIQADWKQSAPGLWTARGKIAAVGLHVSRGVAIHGIALNVQPDLSLFQLITPCGLQGAQVTSIHDHLGKAPQVIEIAEQFAASYAPRSGVLRRTFLRPHELFSYLELP